MKQRRPVHVHIWDKLADIHDVHVWSWNQLILIVLTKLHVCCQFLQEAIKENSQSEVSSGGKLGKCKSEIVS